MVSQVFEFGETRLFTKLVAELLDDDSYAGLQAFLVANSDAGDVIPDTGGLRKIRLSGSGRGKRGGVRVIYYVKLRAGVIWMLAIYGKSTKDTIPAKPCG